MNDPLADKTLRVRAAVTIAQYQHAKPGEVGKKVRRKEQAVTAGGGRYAPSAPPPLKVVGRR